MIKLMQGDCLELMNQIPDQSVDMILCDLPYGTTECSWDSVIPFEPLWAHYRRVIKSNGAVVLTATQPFTTALISSNMRDFKYCWVWKKTRGSGFINSKNKPISTHEDVVVFSLGTTANCSPRRMSYYPQGLVHAPYHKKRNKPMALMEYLIRTYTNEGETVMDNCMGSGTTGVACMNTGRKFIGMEQDAKYFEIAQKRIHDAALPDWRT